MIIMTEMKRRRSIARHKQSSRSGSPTWTASDDLRPSLWLHIITCVVSIRKLKYSVIVSLSPDLLRVRYDIFIRGHPSLSRMFPVVVTVEPTRTAYWISKIVDSRRLLRACESLRAKKKVTFWRVYRDHIYGRQQLLLVQFNNLSSGQHYSHLL